jgi:tryptophan-rich sensory protein
MDYIITFTALFITDVVNTLYIKSINEEQPLAASLWAVVLTLAASVAVINYTRDNIMLIPALLGAFVGTYVGMKIKNSNET